MNSGRDEFLECEFLEEGVLPEMGSEDGRVWIIGHEGKRCSMQWKQDE